MVGKIMFLKREGGKEWKKHTIKPRLLVWSVVFSGSSGSAGQI